MKRFWSPLKAYRKECVLGPAFKLLEALFELTVPLIVAVGFDLYRRLDTEEREKYVKSYIPPISMTKGYYSSYSDDAGFADYTIYFPVYDTVCELYLGLKKDSEILSARPYKNEKPVVFYGSSITQGGGACRTGLAYESIISRELDTEFINLGFSGSARGEKPIVDHIAGLDMSAFVLDYDHNAYDTALLEATHLPFYRAVREKNELPLPDRKKNAARYLSVKYSYPQGTVKRFISATPNTQKLPESSAKARKTGLSSSMRTM